ncbi:MAG: thioredoxin family protein [Pseudomonadota bacterium]
MTRLLLRSLVPLALLASLAASAQSLSFGGQRAGATSTVTTPEVRAELLAQAPQGVAPGATVWLGLDLTHQPGWHTYWKNPGDSGLPTQLEWRLPPGVTAGEIAWPAPHKIPIGSLANYGYEKTVLLPVPLTIGPEFKAAELQVGLHASWLVCKKECIPQEGDFSIRVPVQGSTAGNGTAFEAARAAAPRPILSKSSDGVEVVGQSLKVVMHGLPAALHGKTLEVFPETGGVTEPAGAWQQAWRGTAWTATLPLSAHRSANPDRLALVVTLPQTEPLQGWRAELPVTGTWPALSPIAAVSPALQAALQSNAETGPKPYAAAPASSSVFGLTAALAGALLGGLILNLMPCVFPVLAVKMVGFVQHHDPRTRAASGVAYTAGTVLSFVALGGLLLGLRAAGEQLGWGFQLQSPAFVAGLALLFTVLALNLAGLFEFGQFLPSRVASAQASHPTVNSFLSGVLATAIASPCTAPFMGASLGLAIALPAAQALAVFAAIGLGMALPYLLASLIPGLANAMPRPGAWMQTFRRLMAFPMFATVVWLVWVLGQQSGIDGAGLLLALMVLVAFALWTGTLAGRARQIGALAAALALASTLWWGGHLLTAPAPAAAVALKEERWQPWSADRAAELTASGRSAMVDFTAAWCVTCQYNKKTTLSDPALLAELDNKKVALLRADWTRRDPAITEALRQLGRSGVPVYVFYHPGQAPVVLSEILSVSDVRNALSLRVQP